MRGRFAILPVAAGLLALVVQTELALGQPSFGGRGGRGPGGGFSFDPNSIFDKYAQGRPFFLISDTNKFREPLAAWAQQHGIRDEKITREQFQQAWPVIMEGMKARFQSGGFRGGLPPPPGATPAVATPGGTTPSPGSSPDFWKTYAEEDFKHRDVNGDGKLNIDEMGRSLHSELAKWDTNKDGLIDLNEYLPYFQARMASGQANGGRPLPPIAVIIEDELDTRPTVFRAGKLPKELPPWFQQLDADNDGQVSLYEWRKGRKPLPQFSDYDRNNDGFLTAEEVLRYEALAKAGTAQPGQQIAGTGGRPSFPGMQAADGGPGGSRGNGFPGGGKKNFGGKRGGPRGGG